MATTPDASLLEQHELTLLRERLQQALWLLALLYPAFHLVDLFLIPEALDFARSVRLVVAGSALGALLLLFRTPDGPALRILSVVSFLFATGGMIALTAISGGFHSIFSIGLMMCLFGALFLPWRSQEGMAFVGVNIAAFVGVNITLDGWSAAGVLPTAVLLCSGLIVVAIFATNTRSRRAVLTASLQLRTALRMERQLRRHREELAAREDRLTQLGERTSMLAHDLRNSLSVSLIIGDQVIQETSDDALRSDIGLMTLAAQTAVNALDEVVTYARGEMVVRMQRISLRSFLQGSLPLLRVRAAANGVQLSLGSIPDTDLDVDPRLLQRALENLIHNAIDAVTDDCGQVVIEAEVDGDGLVLRVLDDGPGVPPGNRDELFTPFVSRGKLNGVGLGLTVVHSIAVAHSGHVTFDCPGRLGGATFSLRLPLEQLGNSGDIPLRQESA